MLGVLHGHKIIENKILYIFNEFDLLIDVKGRKLIDYLNDQTTAYKQEKIYNLTEGLRKAITEKTLSYYDLIDIYQGIKDKVKFSFRAFFENFSDIRSNEKIDISDIMIFTECLLSEINHLNRKIINERKSNNLTSLNTFQEEISIRRATDLIEDMAERKTVVIVENVLPEYIVKVLIDKADKLYYIGSKELFEKNVQIFQDYRGEAKIEFVQDYSIEDYFSEIIKYVAASTTREKINNLLHNEHQSFHESVLDIKSSIPEIELDNLLQKHVNLITFDSFPYLCIYSILQEKPAYFVDSLFINFKRNYGHNLLQCLEMWHNYFNECNTPLLISPNIYNELLVNDHRAIDAFFVLIEENQHYQLFKNEETYIEEILETINIEAHKEYFEVKLIDHVIQKYDLSYLNFSDSSRKVKKYCEELINTGNIQTIEDLSENIREVIEKYKIKYNDKQNVEWIHSEGYKNRNSTIAPFTLKFKKESYFQDKVNAHRTFRPFISKNVIFFIEKDKANIFDVFSKSMVSYSLNTSKLSSINFASYDTNLILSENSEAYLINKECTKIDLQVKIDDKVYKGIRIFDQYVYFFPSPKILVRTPLDDFIKGLSVFSGEELKFPNEISIQEEVIDLLIDHENVYWLCKSHVWKMDINTKEINMLGLNEEEPKKIFLKNSVLYILFANSIWALNRYMNFCWITDLPDWARYTVCEDCLFLISGSIIYVVNLNNGKFQIIQSGNKIAYSDIISTEKKLLIIDETGNISEGVLTNSAAKNISLEIKFLYKIEGQRGMISYSHRILSINCEKNIHVFGA